MQRKYCVVLRATSSIRFEGAGEVKFVQGKRTVVCRYRDILSQDQHGTDLHTGIQAEIELNASSLDEAVQKGGEIGDAFLTFISFTAQASVEALQPHLAYDITPGVADREFVQFIYNLDLPTVAKRTLEGDRFESLLEAVQNSEHQQRIGRAMRWYRKSLLESDVLDRFMNLWAGLECLNPRLKQKWGLPSETRTCEKCGYEQAVPTVVGIRHLMCNYFSDGNGLYREAHELRNGLVHGYANLSELKRKAKRINPDLEKALIKGILILLEIPKAEHDQWMRESLTNVPPLSLEVRALLHEPNLEYLRKEGQHPHFKAEHVILSSLKGPNGKTKFKLQSKLKPGFSCSYTPLSVVIRGPSEGYQVEFCDTGE